MFEAFTIGPAIIWLRLVFLLLGTWLAAEFFFRLALSANLSLQHMQENAWRYAVAFLVSGRLMAVVATYRIYLRDPMRIFILWDGGFSFLGGAMGIGAVLFLLTREHRATFLQWLDVLLPATTFGLAFDWFGKFAAAQSYGKPTNFFLGMVFDTINVRYAVPIHPVQLYYAFFFLLLTFALLVIRKHARRAGSETLLGIIAASAAVFLLEFLRGDFGIPVFANVSDFIFLGCLFGSLGVLALIEHRMTERENNIYTVVVAIATIIYVIARQWISIGDIQLRFSQLLAILALLAAVVYVVVHRRKYPHL